MKKMLLVALLMSGSVLVGMEKEKSQPVQSTQLVKNRYTATVAGHRDALVSMVKKLDALGEEFCGSEINLMSILPSNQQEWQKLFNTLQKVDAQTFLEDLKVKVFASLGEIDPEIYTPLYQFGTGVAEYYNKFMLCNSDEDVKNLLKDIEKNKNQIIASFNQCAPIVLKLGHVCMKAAFNQCLLLMPNELREYLPLAGAGVKLALTTYKGDSNLSLGDMPDFTQYLPQLAHYLSQGYLTKVLAGINTFGGESIKVSPQILRSVYFVEQCAKIFLPTQRQEHLMALVCNPTQEISFPLNDGYFKGKTFEQICRNAFEGDLEVIKNFAEMYPDLLRKEDKDKQNVLAYAVTGYCSGNDAAWKVIKYLLEQDSMVTETTLDILKKNSTDKDLAKKQDRDNRKGQVLLLTVRRAEFYVVDKNKKAFYEVSEKPLVVVKEQPQASCIVS